ncbi:tetratricopeptide repeat-containing sensor histidine kinase [Sediminibacterium ginsengisoli]|uniref:tetratricopeptide repeat-containing sensor histidine kinase n=1 Tax=Sediminibacterium ginsengisoli TaxID=413434 RepID=UPI001FE75FF0|nr:tetratricopeptide repeat-containing sensor histidine kinase [Sediminibacterium ginsengisoli]
MRTEPDYEKADSLMSSNTDSAFYYYNKVATNSKDSLLIARAYNGMAIIQTDAGDYFGSQQSLLLSLKYLDETKEENQYCLLSDYNELGNTSLNLQNYDAAINYYNLALKFSKNQQLNRIALNNMGVAYYKKGEFKQAIEIYRSIIDSTRKNRKEYARVLSNMAKVLWLQNPDYRALPDFQTALRIRKAEKDDWGLNASYSHLADYYYKSYPDSALSYAGKMYDISRNLNSPDDELEALKKLIMLSRPERVKMYFERYRYLSDSVQAARNTAKNQFALIHFDVEKSKTDNLRLQKENAEKNTQLLMQSMIGSLIFLLFIAVIIVSYRKNKKRQERLKQESEIARREEKLRASKKVHDEIANGLYRIMAEVQHNNLEKEKLLDKIDALYEQSRDISYEWKREEPADFSETINGLLNAFSSEEQKVTSSGNEAALWAGVNNKVKQELLPVLQELMVNMQKHSGAGSVAIRFKKEHNILQIHYADDGKGLPENFRKKNGLTSTGNRIVELRGEFNFDIDSVKGLKIRINIPIN